MKKNFRKNICHLTVLALVIGLFLSNGPAVRAEGEGEGQAQIEVINGTREDASTHEPLSNSETYTFTEGEDLSLGFMQPSEGFFKPTLIMNGVDVSIKQNDSIWNGDWNLEYQVNSGYPNGWVRITGYKLAVGNHSFTVTFQPIDYTINFDANGGTGEMDPVSAKYDVNVKLPKCTMKNNGLVFKEWNTETDGSGQSFKDKASVSKLTTEKDGNVTLYAQWKKKAKDDPEPAPAPAETETQEQPFSVPNTATYGPAHSLPVTRSILAYTCLTGIVPDTNR